MFSYHRSRLHYDLNDCRSAAETDRTGSADSCLGVDRRRADIDGGNGRINNKVIFLRILAESRCQGISVDRDSGRLLFGLPFTVGFAHAVSGMLLNTGILKDKCLFLHRIRICSCELRALSGRALHVGHILVLVQIAALHIKLF